MTAQLTSLNTDCLRTVFVALVDEFLSFRALAITSKAFLKIAKHHELARKIYQILVAYNEYALGEMAASILGFIHFYREHSEFAPIVHEIPIHTLAYWLKDLSDDTQVPSSIKYLVASDLADEYKDGYSDDREFLTPIFQNGSVFPQSFKEGILRNLTTSLSSAMIVFKDDKLRKSMSSLYGPRLPFLLLRPWLELSVLIWTFVFVARMLVGWGVI